MCFVFVFTVIYIYIYALEIYACLHVPVHMSVLFLSAVLVAVPDLSIYRSMHIYMYSVFMGMYVTKVLCQTGFGGRWGLLLHRVFN